MILDIVLDTCAMAPNQVLVLADRRGKRVRVDANGSAAAGTGGHAPPAGIRSPRVSRTRVVLERWRIDFVPSSVSSSFSPPATSSGSFSAGEPAQQAQALGTELPAVYKQAVVLFRALYTLVRTLPSWQLHRRLARRGRVGGAMGGLMGGGGGIAGTGNGPGLQIGCRLSTEEDTSGAVAPHDEIPLEMPLLGQPNALSGGGAYDEEQEHVETFTFAPLQTPLGTLLLKCSYRLNTDFAVEDNETLLSSRFIDEDFFKPTLRQLHGGMDDDMGNKVSVPLHPGCLPSADTRMLQAGSLPTRHGPSPLNPKSRPSYGSLSSRHQVVPTSTSPVDPARVPLPGGSLGTTPVSLPDSAGGSSGRFGSYSGAEPAFITLSRARAASSSTGIVRASQGSSQSSMPVPARRTSLTSVSPSSGSPIFRAGSYLSSPPLSASPYDGPTSNINRISSGAAASAGGTSLPPSSLRNSTQGPSLAVSRTSSTVTGGVAVPPPRPVQGSSYGSMPRYYSRSFGQGSSGGSGEHPWQGPESLGRRSSRPAGTSGGHSAESQKRFLPTAADDSDDIRSFLSLLDSKPDLHGPEDGASAIVSKSQADETLKRLAGSVYTASDSDSSWRMESLRRRTSRLSIEEEPAGGALGVSPASGDGSGGSGSGPRTRIPIARRSNERYDAPSSGAGRGSYPSQPSSLGFRTYISRGSRPGTGSLHGSGSGGRGSPRFSTGGQSSGVASFEASQRQSSSIVSGESEDVTASTSSATHTPGDVGEEEAVGHLELSEPTPVSAATVAPSDMPLPPLLPSHDEVLADRASRWSEASSRSRDRTPAAMPLNRQSSAPISRRHSPVLRDYFAPKAQDDFHWLG